MSVNATRCDTVARGLGSGNEMTTDCATAGSDAARIPKEDVQNNLNGCKSIHLLDVRRRDRISVRAEMAAIYK